MSFRRFTFALLLVGAALFGLASASAELPSSSVRYLDDGVQRITYRIGPIDVTPGQNRIAYRPLFGAEKPAVDGWLTRLKPDLVNEDGSVPLSSKVMFHHGVWLNLSRKDATTGSFERFYATGEEKTITSFPQGFGYQYKASDTWLLNHMIHNLTPQPMKLYATYTVDFIPAGTPAAEGMKAVTPIWMDVENGGIYPVFDVFRDSGGKDGKFTYPDDAGNPYPSGVEKNKWTVDRDGVLVATAGHVHTGGLYTDLYLERDGAKYAGPKCVRPPVLKQKPVKLRGRKGEARRKALKRNRKLAKRKAKARKRYQSCLDRQPDVEGNKVHLFRSKAHYFEPAGPVSWDMAMLGTRDDWMVEVKKGDVLSTTTTYETKIASWPESMGIMVAYMAEGQTGNDPYKRKVDYPGILIHGHYPENDDHGGKLPLVGPDATSLPDGVAYSGNPLTISDYFYQGADFRLPGASGRPPVVPKGQSIKFQLSDYDLQNEVWHSLTSCKAPCNKSTGIAYPIADGEFQFESGQMGTLPGPNKAPTVDRTWWETPGDLPKGTYTFFCRVHPLMRGAFRVK
ncbi:MAG: hypothetical protein KDB48_07530 [Solirubrobacterales bacterium]|nr:hypothetical protein [Solirubrobacterales bacterium]